MEEVLIGRQKEQNCLAEYINSGRSEFVVVYGRRRVGKTFLVRNAIADSNLLTEDEQTGARKTLRAAALTYVAATAVAFAQLLRLILLFGRRRYRYGRSVSRQGGGNYRGRRRH